MKLSLCASEHVSIALKPFSYELHGHDVEVEACWCLEPSRRVDIEDLYKRLKAALAEYDHRPLWEVLGREGAMIEDMLLSLRGELGEELCRLEARWRGRRIGLNF
ncbi:MAG: hypothetical protein NZ902_00955 [Acidilobaceae archaeon]|nr:hypothetical protein [Acidilobaceae archaeon]MCX8165397.1 hypothetical protein [Acidilobaceae archaeon]MDW7973824.1 hypothetical protein [Sulfolobales archaeon]